MRSLTVILKTILISKSHEVCNRLQQQQQQQRHKPELVGSNTVTITEIPNPHSTLNVLLAPQPLDSSSSTKQQQQPHRCHTCLASGESSCSSALSSLESVRSSSGSNANNSSGSSSIAAHGVSRSSSGSETLGAELRSSSNGSTVSRDITTDSKAIDHRPAKPLRRATIVNQDVVLEDLEAMSTASGSLAKMTKPYQTLEVVANAGEHSLENHNGETFFSLIESN